MTMPSVSARKFADHVNGLAGCFVAGGAITSVYTNKPVADVDVYQSRGLHWPVPLSGHTTRGCGVCSLHSGR